MEEEKEEKKKKKEKEKDRNDDDGNNKEGEEKERNKPKSEEKRKQSFLRLQLAWKNLIEPEKIFCQMYKKGSRSTTKRERKKAQELQEEVKKSLLLQDFYKR